MKIIQTRLSDMPSSLLAELGSYRYRIFSGDNGWSVPSRLYTPGQEYDRFDCSAVNWLIAWHPQTGICGCVRLIPWQRTPDSSQRAFHQGAAPVVACEMSRFSARIEVDPLLPLQLLWHALQLAQQCGKQAVICAATPILEELFSRYQIDYSPVASAQLQSEEHLFAIRIPVKQPVLAEMFPTSRCFRPEEVLPSLGVSVNWRRHQR
ncbi:autoinducer synthase [Erwinia sp. OLTSP20]|uniref:acyl-homoserine-lactone synthase n=1 Tax=unclassified Erwinia TaxID=2622719 RepID=UPI000C19EDA2|nr:MULTISPECIES: acyl-homoserine-lactone synthase [unclassified Erwinia]PIJ51376.1 autoinducer synthase [Erwinia sp. OAMSP11]PIJ74160.1 autoinducer synthase [Erwinia sp. OLSSP12]PIJ81550.1 autoinducer synthase [Erwinia sp. OLCASP19]PIJ86123.1 autoinducer synthase [Erwinia sp. OLMTSP26]PIJ87871.1 autoinducer synthase [Erwinia sp. OLMDSP33]